MSRWPGRFITRNSVTPSGPAPTSSAPGVWTLPEVAYWNRQGLWPNASADPYWSYVSFLLGTTATNTQQNNTFLDSSTNNFTLTRFGNATQGAFTPYGTLWSNYFDGSGDYLSVSAASALNQSGDFTVEAWICLNASPSATTPVYAFEVTNFMKFAINTTRNLTVDQANVGVRVTGSTALSQGVWYHIAFVRSGTGTNNCKIYLNGVQEGQFTDTSTTTVSGTGRICSRPDATSGFLSCYLSNLRVTNTAIYTAAFTPPAAPLTAISGTSVLTCQSNRFIDNSGNAFAITKNGDTRVAPFSPFVLAPPGYDTSVNGGSGYFDGSGGGITAPNNAAFNLGSGNFTLECWVYNSEVANNCGYAGIWGGGYILYREGTTYRFYYGGPSGSPLTPSIAAVVGAWTHLAVVRNGTTLTFYVNGVSGGSTNVSTTAINFSGQPFGIGANFETGSPGFPFTGYMAGLRLVKGTAIYTAAFTPPTTPPTAVSGTSILCNFTNAGAFDASMNNDMETVGNAQVSTGQAKYGTTSVYFDGVGDQLLGQTNPNLAFGTGDFTIEAWVYQTQRNTLSDITSCHNYGVAADWLWSINSSGNLFFQIGSSGTGSQTSSSTVPLNTWTHVAVSRQNGVVKQFIAGTQVSSATYATSVTNTIRLSVGSASNLNANSTFYGYIDDLRITNGYARYTSNFTPPTAALPVY